MSSSPCQGLLYRGKPGFSPTAAPNGCPFSRQICEDSGAGNHPAVLSQWNDAKEVAALTVPALEAVVVAMVLQDTERLSEVLQYLGRTQARPAAVYALVASILKLGRVELAQHFVEMLEGDKRTVASVTGKVRKLILGKFASGRQVAKVKQILKNLEGDEKVGRSLGKSR